ncbi:helix-turn-helix domain-containing protein [Oceanospirillum maris]|uniref:helix-turn-helix domain-containing protein n=1 Tax=Oceanospirillum maris TaxID=64977 RepID=UPI0005608853|nr:helix-turn-helix transcriptional regulator [Oceanospirillum maris]
MSEFVIFSVVGTAVGLVIGLSFLDLFRVGGSGGDMVSGFDFWLGNFFQYKRRAKGLRQAEVARRLGVSGAQLSRFENGESRMSAFQLFKLAEVLDVEISEIEIKGL